MMKQQTLFSDTYVWLSVGLFLLLSLVMYVYVPDQRCHFDIDSVGYDNIARNFSQHGFLEESHRLGVHPVQTVGYPFFVGLIYTLFGANISAVIFLQLLLAIACGLLMYAIAHDLFNKSTARITLFLWSCNVGFLVYPQVMLAEILLTFFVLLFFHLFFSFLKSKKNIHLILAGLVLGISILIKPMALFFVPLLLMLCTFFSKALKVHTKTFLFLLLFSVSVPVLGYMARNYRMYNFFALAPMTSLNMYQCFLSKVIARVEHRTVADVIDTQLRFKSTNFLDDAGWSHARSLFFTYLKQYPHMFVVVWFENVIKTVLGLFSTQMKLLFEPTLRGGDCSFFKEQGSLMQKAMGYIASGTQSTVIQSVALLEAIWNIMRWLLVIAALYFLCALKRYFLSSLFVLFIAQCALVTGIDGCCRYRITFEPLLIMLTAYALFQLYVQVKGASYETV